MSQESLGADDWEIIKKYSDMVYRMACSLLKNKYDAEDVHQEVFIQFIRKRPSFESIEHEKAWFLRVTINLCKNNWKTAWKRKVVSLMDEGCEETVELQTDELIDTIKQLPQKYRMVIHLFYYEELSIQEIAGILNTKLSTVRTHLTRARAKLKQILEEDL